MHAKSTRKAEIASRFPQCGCQSEKTGDSGQNDSRTLCGLSAFCNPQGEDGRVFFPRVVLLPMKGRKYKSYMLAKRAFDSDIPFRLLGSIRKVKRSQLAKGVEIVLCFDSGLSRVTFYR